MIARNEIWTPASEISLGEEFRQETMEMLKKVASDNKCNVEELKFSVNNLGVVNIQRMTSDEMLEMESKRIVEKEVKKIKKERGLAG